MITTDKTTAPVTDTEVYHESFADGPGVAVQSGGASLTQVTDKTFAGNDDGTALYVSDRQNDYSAADFNFTDIGLENGKTYTVTVTGYVDSDVTVPTDAQVVLSTVDSYTWLSNVNFVAGEAFTLTKEFTVDTSADSKLRVQSNGEGATVPFYVGDILITEEATSGGEEPAPEDDRPDALPFETVTFEDQDLAGFEARGEVETLTVTDEANNTADGSYALKVEDREQAWNGPSLRVEQFIDKGLEYKITAWVKLISPDSSQLQLSTQVGSGDGASYNNLEGKTVTAADGWVQFEGTYRYSSVGDEYVTIYVESSNNATASYYIDDISFEPTGTGTVEVQKDLTPIKDVYQNDFLIGNAVSAKEFEGTRLELLTMHHNVVTAENAMKPGYAYGTYPEFDFTAEDALVTDAHSAGLDMVGHVLVWHQQSEESLHTDANGDPLPREEALANLRNHVKTTVEHFGDRVISWDVVNEAMNDNPPNPSDWKASLRNSGWLKAIGTDYVKESFLAAKEALNGKDVKLYYNDYNDDNQNKAEAIYQMIKEINEEYKAENNGELLIDGMGMQAHYNLNTNPENVEKSLEKFTSVTSEVSVTELDVTAGSDNVLTEAQEVEQAYLYAQLFKLYKEYAGDIARVTFWGLNDATSWRAAQSPLLFDADLQAKEAYYAVIDPEKYIAENEPVEKVIKQGNALYGTPSIDGSVDDIWSDAPELPVNQYQMAWQGASGVTKALWDNENLYVLVNVSDAQLDKSNANAWEQDSIEVFVDQNNEKTSSYQDDDGQYRVNFDNETSFNPPSIADGFVSATKVDGTNYTVEVKIPLDSITPANDTEIGFDVQINDAKDGARQSAATWNDTAGTGYQDTSVFGVLNLVAGDNSTDPGDGGETPDPGEEPGDSGETPEKPSKDVVVVKPVVKDKTATVDIKEVKKVKKDGQLIVDLSENDSSIVVSFTEEQIKELKEKNATITITKKDVKVEIPASLLTNGNKAVDIKITKMKDIDGALSAVYDFKIVQGGEEISEFSGKVTLTFSVDTSKVDNPDNVKVFYWNPDSKAWELVGGTYKDGSITVEVDHFSTYTVFETSGEDSPDTEDPQVEDGQELPDTATSTFNWLVVGFTLLIAGAAFFLLSNRRRA
ncbi:LPXTG cell wall anchor domain-containing protein [Aquibacillus halophilus]|uniref:Beta-xylanase n=4 Tax=Aquibacillus halophilus TaxID=930132 RepID=A0A6A8DDL6_9BACI|nr:LPXTG cell wall anchor domain-containing protein [Aquibacillus halophilus]